MTDYTIDYDSGFYCVMDAGRLIAHASTNYDANQIVAGLQEAEASALMGGMEPPPSAEMRRPYCDYNSEPTFAHRYIAPMFEIPLLAQCAAVIRTCLGNAPAGGGIIPELRRVEAELSKAGW